MDIEGFVRRSIKEEDLVEAAQVIDDIELGKILLSKTKDKAFIRM